MDTQAPRRKQSCEAEREQCARRAPLGTWRAHAAACILLTLRIERLRPTGSGNRTRLRAAKCLVILPELGGRIGGRNVGHAEMERRPVRPSDVEVGAVRGAPFGR